MQNTVLVAGSVNMDLVIKVDNLPAKGETLMGNTIRYIPGGKGANQAVAAKRLGADVFLIGKVGQDAFGLQLREFLDSEGLKLTGLGNSPLASGMAVITVDKNGNNTIVVLPGSNIEVDGHYIKQHASLIRAVNIVVAQLEIPLQSVDTLFTLAKRFKKTTLLNPAPAHKIPRSLLQKVDYLILNETELSFFVAAKETIVDVNKIATFARFLQIKGPKIVVVTLGARGVVTITQNKAIRTEGIKVKAIDTTAAGDCFVGALAVQMNKGVKLEDALDFANRAAALSVQRIGASSSLPILEEVLV